MRITTPDGQATISLHCDIPEDSYDYLNECTVSRVEALRVADSRDCDHDFRNDFKCDTINVLAFLNWLGY